MVKTIELDSFYFSSQRNIFEVCCLDTHIAEKEVQKFCLKSTVNGSGRGRKKKKKETEKAMISNKPILSGLFLNV